jgi:hypothetical protein
MQGMYQLCTEFHKTLYNSILPINRFENKEELHSWIWKSCRVQDVLHQMRSWLISSCVIMMWCILHQKNGKECCRHLANNAATTDYFISLRSSFSFSFASFRFILMALTMLKLQFAIHYIYPLSYNMHTTNSSPNSLIPPSPISINLYIRDTSREYPMESSLFFLTPQSKTTTHHQSDTSLTLGRVFILNFTLMRCINECRCNSEP